MKIVITGATGAIGQALALEYASPGITLCLQGRNRKVLEEIALICQKRGAAVDLECMDLLHSDELKKWADRLCADDIPDLLIINAGMNIHTRSDIQGESIQASQELLSLNLLSSILLVQHCLPSMRQRGSGQIALISSLAAWRGLPKTPSYSASKAGLKAYGEALRTDLANEGIRVNVVLPGYVESAMSQEMPGPKPWIWKPQRAAKVIRHGLAHNKGRISFPFFLSVGCHALAVLPDSIAGWLLRKFGYG